jgi:RNA polymerase sigma-70 factor (ECF subfamily)
MSVAMPRDSDSSSHPDSLKALSARIASGDAGAFDDLHDRLAGGLRAMFLKRAGNRMDVADDLVQRTWYLAWGSIRDGRYDPCRAAISTFVYAVANNVWLQHCRAHGRQPSESPMPDVVAPDNPATLAQYAELLESVRECVHGTATPNQLTPDERRIVTGVATGESERQLAAEFGVAASTINLRKKAAYDKIRTCLAAKGFSDEIVEQLDLRYE